jgi:small subunit ribosomal protein S5
MRVPVTAAGSIPHEVMGDFCGSTIRLVPCAEGTGIIAGASVRAICEMAGIRNVLTKCYGSTNSVNVVKAAMLALASLRTPAEVSALRGVEI